MEALAISKSALDVEWRRMEVIAQNLANINTTRTSSGDPYVPVRLVSGPAEGFQQALANTRNQVADARPTGVRVYGLERMDGATRRAYEPGHPHADPQGFVIYPEISQAQEMTLMLKTARAYEANLVAMGAAGQMYASALQLGRSS